MSVTGDSLLDDESIHDSLKHFSSSEDYFDDDVLEDGGPSDADSVVVRKILEIPDKVVDRIPTVSKALSQAILARIRKDCSRSSGFSENISMQDFLARKHLGLQEPVDASYEARFGVLFEQQDNLLLRDLEQPLDKRRLIKGKFQKARFAIDKLLDPTQLAKDLPALVGQDELTAFSKRVNDLENKKHILRGLSPLETSFSYMSLARLSVAWRKLTSLCTIPLSDNQDQVLDKVDKLKAFRAGLLATLGIIHYELSGLDLLFHQRNEDEREIFQKELLNLHLERMQKLPVKPAVSQFAMQNHTQLTKMKPPLTIQAVQKESNRLLKVQVNRVKSKHPNFFQKKSQRGKKRKGNWKGKKNGNKKSKKNHGKKKAAGKKDQQQATKKET